MCDKCWTYQQNLENIVFYKLNGVILFGPQQLFQEEELAK